jgi:hypothetical protein
MKENQVFQNDFERKQDVISHWERMISWVKMLDYSGKNTFIQKEMYDTLGENPGSDYCAFCSKYLIEHSCTECPIAEQYGSCGEGNNYPGRYGEISKWLPQAKGFLEDLKNLKVDKPIPEPIPEPKPIDWTKPVRDIWSKKNVVVEDAKKISTSLTSYYTNLEGIIFGNSHPVLENIPEDELFQGIKPGDRVYIKDNWIEGEYILAQTNPNTFAFISLNDGNKLTDPRYLNPPITLPMFKVLLGSFEKDWVEIYSTLKKA